MLQKELLKLSRSEKILLVGDLWDNIAEKDIPVTVAEKKFVKGRIDNLASRNYKTRSWGSIKSQMGLNK